jgi:hypothetical protein
MVHIRSKVAWKKHVYLDLQPYTCYLQSCFSVSTPFDTRDQWAEHLDLEHNLGPEWNSIRCPLCEEETGDGRIKVTLHVASHLEEIALAAIPASVEDCESSDTESVASEFSNGSMPEDENIDLPQRTLETDRQSLSLNVRLAFFFTGSFN